jgi:large subunit ribosomal protein L30
MATPKARKRNERIEALVRRLSAAKGTSEKKYEVTLERSEIGGTQNQRATLDCLGLRRRGSKSVVADTPEMRGRIRTVAHLVSVEEI